MELACSELVLKSSCKAYDVYGCRWGESCYQAIDKETGLMIRDQVSALRAESVASAAASQ